MTFDIKKLQLLNGREIKYSKLCEELGLDKKQGDSKTAQLKDLELYCDIRTLYNPTRYIISNVASLEEFEMVEEMNRTQRTSTLFEIALYKAFLENNCQPLYLSKVELLMLLTELNDNFYYSRNEKVISEIAPELGFLPSLSESAFNILYKWNLRQLEFLHKRSILILRDGFRLYKRVHNEKYNFLVKRNVVVGSDEEKECIELRAKAIENVIPDYLLKDKSTRWGKGNFTKKEHYHINKELERRVKEKYDNEYDFMARVYVVYPPSVQAVEQRLKSAYGQLEVYDKINKTASDKIISTKELDKKLDRKGYTDVERRLFVDINMKTPPLVDLKKIWEYRRALSKEKLEFEFGFNEAEENDLKSPPVFPEKKSQTRRFR